MTATRTGKRTLKRVAHEWLALNAQIGEMANYWSSRNDLTAYIGPDGGRNVAAALYDPATGEIEVNTTEAFGETVDPKHVGNFTQRKVQFDWPKAAGFVMHEAGHARWSTCDLIALHKELKPHGQAHEYFMLMDEGRIEHMVLDAYPDNRAFLRASALDLVMLTPDELANEKNPTELAIRLVLLGMGRITAGVLDKKDMKKTRPLIDKMIDRDIQKAMRALWTEFQGLDDRLHLTRMRQIAIEMAELCKKAHEDNGTDPSGDGPKDENGQPRELTPEEMDALGDLIDALGMDAAAAELDANREAQDQKKAEKRQQDAIEKKRESEEQKENKDQAEKTFSVDGPRGTTNSRLVNRRPATPEERVAATKIGQAMDKAKYRDRVVTEGRSSLPPGRLRVGQAMQGKAVEKMGGTNVTEPWARTMRRHVDDPNLTLGLMCDISGSMGFAMPGMASAAWIMSDAVRRIQGTAAAVYYGYSVFSVLKPGEHLKEVTQYSAPDGYEAFDTAFRALDGGLNLLNGTGARLLVVCSDGEYKGDEVDATYRWLNKCKRNGVAVVWLGFNARDAQVICRTTGAHYVELGNIEVTEAATIIGKACTKALTEAGLSRQV